MSDATKGQVLTWFQHAIISALIPPAIAALTAPWVMAPASVTVLIYFWGRELTNRADHIRAGNWETPEPGTGITPRIDMWGDLVGPATAAVAYVLATLVGL